MAQRDELPTRTAGDALKTESASGATLIAAVEEERLPQRVSSPIRDAWRRFRHNWAAMISLAVILILVFAAAFAPFLHTTNPLAMNYTAFNAFPSAHHWFGTDGVGRDLYSRTLYGLRVPLIIGIIGAAITVILGMLFGVISGYYGGVTDTILARFTDLMFAFPAFIMALIVIALYGQWADSIGLGGTGRVVLMTVVFAIVGWPGLMRFVRSLTLGLKEQQFVEAARTVGTSNWRIMVRHLLPNMYGLILVQASFIVISFVGLEAILSLLGLGVQPPNPDLGVLLAQGASVMQINYWEVLVPAALLTTIILAFTFLGDGVRDAVDPRSK